MFAAAADRGAAKQDAWKRRVEAFVAGAGDKGREYQAFVTGDIGDAWRAVLPRYTPADKAMATRCAVIYLPSPAVSDTYDL